LAFFFIKQDTENGITDKKGRRHRVRSKSRAAFRDENQFLSIADCQRGFLFPYNSVFLLGQSGLTPNSVSDWPVFSVKNQGNHFMSIRMDFRAGPLMVYSN